MSKSLYFLTSCRSQQKEKYYIFTRKGNSEPIIVLLQSDSDDFPLETPPFLVLVPGIETVLCSWCLRDLLISIKGHLHYVVIVVAVVNASLRVFNLQPPLLSLIKLVLYLLSLAIREASLYHHRSGWSSGGRSGGQAVEVSPRPVTKPVLYCVQVYSVSPVGGPGCCRHPLVVVAVLRLCPHLQIIFLVRKVLIVKPWSKSWSQQAPKSKKSQIKRKKDLDLGLTQKSHGPPIPPTHR